MKNWKGYAMIALIAVISVMVVKYVVVQFIAPHTSSDIPTKIANAL